MQTESGIKFRCQVFRHIVDKRLLLYTSRLQTITTSTLYMLGRRSIRRAGIVLQKDLNLMRLGPQSMETTSIRLSLLNSPVLTLYTFEELE